MTEPFTLPPERCPLLTDDEEPSNPFIACCGMPFDTMEGASRHTRKHDVLIVEELAPVAEPPKPPKREFSAPKLTTESDLTDLTLRRAVSGVEVPPLRKPAVPPVSALPTQREAEIPAEIYRLIRDYGDARLEWYRKFPTLEEASAEYDRAKDALIAAIRSALSRPPREPSEAATKAAYDTMPPWPGEAYLLAIVETALAAAYAVDFGATPPPGVTK